MARIRSIKPDFFSSEDITNLTPLSRLFYVSLWCESDRRGRFEYKPGTLKNRYFPADKVDIEKLMGELLDGGLVKLYQPEGYPILAWIPTFEEHQVINNRESDSILPAYSVDAAFTRESGVSVEGRKEGKEGREGKGRKEESVTAVAVTTVDPLLHPMMESFKSVHGGFSDYRKETVCLKKVIAGVRNLAPEDPEGAAKLVLSTFHTLTQGVDKFWSGQPFTPSGLSPVLDRVWAEASKQHRATDLSWMEA